MSSPQAQLSEAATTSDSRPTLILQNISVRGGVLAALLLTLVITGCDDAEAIPRHTVSFVQDDGRAIPRHADDIEAVARVLEFAVRPAPAELGGYPLIAVDGIANPPQSHIQYWYGPPETLEDDAFQLAKFFFAQYGNTRVPILSGGRPINIGDQPAWLTDSGQAILIRWEAHESNFTLSGWGATVAATLAAAETILRAAESERLP